MIGHAAVIIPGLEGCPLLGAPWSRARRACALDWKGPRLRACRRGGPQLTLNPAAPPYSVLDCSGSHEWFHGPVALFSRSLRRFAMGACLSSPTPEGTNVADAVVSPPGMSRVTCLTSGCCHERFRSHQGSRNRFAGSPGTPEPATKSTTRARRLSLDARVVSRALCLGRRPCAAAPCAAAPCALASPARCRGVPNASHMGRGATRRCLHPLCSAHGITVFLTQTHRPSSGRCKTSSSWSRPTGSGRCSNSGLGTSSMMDSIGDSLSSSTSSSSSSSSRMSGGRSTSSSSNSSSRSSKSCSATAPAPRGQQTAGPRPGSKRRAKSLCQCPPSSCCRSTAALAHGGCRLSPRTCVAGLRDGCELLKARTGSSLCQWHRNVASGCRHGMTPSFAVTACTHPRGAHRNFHVAEKPC